MLDLQSLPFPAGMPDFASLANPDDRSWQMLDLASMHFPENVINGITVSKLVPSYRITKQGFELKGDYAVHLRRTNIKLNLFIFSFYFSCFIHCLENDVDPTMKFNKLFYDPLVYKHRHGVLKPNTNEVMHVIQRLEVQTRYVKWHGARRVHKFVVARFNDPNSPIDYDFSIMASSINVTLHIGKKMREAIGDFQHFDYAKYFELFLRYLSYDKAIYVVNKKHGALHTLPILQRDVENSRMNVEMFDDYMEA